MAVSFKEFRDRFPDASVLSDLLSVTNQNYVVKVTIQTRDLGSTTGLAAHETLEIAEDHARQRALQALGLEFHNADSPSSMPQASPVPSLETAPAASSQAQVNSPVQPEQTSPPVEGDETLEAVSELVAEPMATEPTVTEPTTEPFHPAPEPTKPATQNRPKSVHRTKVSTEQPEPAPAPTPEAMAVGPTAAHNAPISEAHLPAPINLSDVIAQTDIELRRLGWTVEMGREYLEQTYNKRSRLELSEEELIQFLCHLESLPEPQTIA